MSAGSTDSPDGRVPAAEASPAPVDLPRGVVVLLGTGAAVLTAAGVRSFADIIGPAFLALVLTIAVSPLRRLLVRRGMKGWLAALIALVVVNAFLLGVAAALALSLAKLAGLLPAYQDKFAELVADTRGWLADHGIGQAQLEAALQKFDIGRLFDLLQSWLGGLLGVFGDLAFIVAVLFFMGIDAVHFPDRLRAAARARPDVTSALTGFAWSTTRYLIVSTIFGVIVALFDVGVLYLLDIPLPWLWGLLALITNYIPNIGFFIGVIPPALLALLDHGWATLVWVIVAYSVINFIIQSLIQPKVVGDAVGLSTTLTFLSLVFWAWLLGPLGAVLAIPLSLLVKALLLDADPSTRWLSGLISGDQLPGDAPPAEPAELPPGDVAAEPVG
ncbi:AI-2E family transporter [Kribbella capetownensis]|uniref:AI-2E family transporter n=1 Tax=Kribbella capetownensis TaxID=1572659 RepID=A0A4R0K2B1_9ACTN|nr:AI-2E family transporter [Kribbella capetownensis]TCC48975.1 AI-2E family transporter [Kribbella capetownensis]